jgi:SAM-dependent methyltransferase
MTEYRLFEGEVPFVSTAEFHADRERAPHLEQEFHQGRLHLAAQMVMDAAAGMDKETVLVSDLGCGDGGLLQLLKAEPRIAAWGYDFSPANAAGWTERGVQAQLADVFSADWHKVGIMVGDIVVMTETLEHLADPHEVLARLRRTDVQQIVCSSPFNESPGNHSPEHAWAWDLEGYAAMIGAAGWKIVRHEQVDLFQVVLARRDG